MDRTVESLVSTGSCTLCDYPRLIHFYAMNRVCIQEACCMCRIWMRRVPDTGTSMRPGFWRIRLLDTVKQETAQHIVLYYSFLGFSTYILYHTWSCQKQAKNCFCCDKFTFAPLSAEVEPILLKRNRSKPCLKQTVYIRSNTFPSFIHTNVQNCYNTQRSQPIETLGCRSTFLRNFRFFNGFYFLTSKIYSHLG